MIIKSKKELSLGMLAMLLVKISFGSTFKKKVNHLKVWILKHLNIGKNCPQKKYCCTVFLIRLMLKLNYENFKVGSITIFMLKFPMMVRNTYLQDRFLQKNLSTEIRQQKFVLLQEALKKTILPNCIQIRLLVEKKVSGLW